MRRMHFTFIPFISYLFQGPIAWKFQSKKALKVQELMWPFHIKESDSDTFVVVVNLLYLLYLNSFLLALFSF